MQLRKMDRAINKETGNEVDAIEVFQNSSYQTPYKDKWIAPKEYINNWEELEKKELRGDMYED